MYLTLADVLVPRIKRYCLTRDLLLTLWGSLLIALLAQASFWIGPVPITGQTFAVLMLAALLGSRRGSLSVLAYLIEGAFGLPVFASGRSGLAAFVGPTGGYLIGFVFAAWLVGLLAEKKWDRNPWTTILTMILGNILIYSCGLLWLWLLFFAGRLPSDSKGLLAAGLYPFIIGDFLKILLAAWLLPTGWKLLARKEFRKDVER